MNERTPLTNDTSHCEFAIIENENGMAVIMREEGIDVAHTAAMHKGVVIDPGPYKSFEDANDALTEWMDPESGGGRSTSTNWPSI